MTEMTAGQIAYRSFLETDFWKTLSAEKRRLIGKCEQCGSSAHLQAHHVTYHPDWFETTLDDLQVLCRKHHKEAHGLMWEPPSPVVRFREDDRFNRFCHWCLHLRMRICGAGVRLKARERRYLQTGLGIFPDGAFLASLVLGDDEFFQPRQ